MKNIIKKNWIVTTLGAFAAIYEVSSYFFGLSFIPNKLKIAVAIIALIGAAYKKYKEKK